MWRGFLFDRFAAWMGRSGVARGVTLVVTTVGFALVHVFDQGLYGAVQAIFSGSVFGILYLRTGRLPLVVIAHATFNVTAITLIAGGWETAAAHWLWR